MGRNAEESSPLLLSYAALRPKFPLGLFPESLQPYLELIRLEKVYFVYIQDVMHRFSL